MPMNPDKKWEPMSYKNPPVYPIPSLGDILKEFNKPDGEGGQKGEEGVLSWLWRKEEEKKQQAEEELMQMPGTTKEHIDQPIKFI